jgi:predicted dehydrogenase
VNGRPRWGIVGTGGISRTTVGDLHLTKNVDLVAVASRTAKHAEAFAIEHGVPRWYENHDAMFKNGRRSRG